MSIKVMFPDGAVREYAQGTTGTTVVEGISKSLAKNTVAMKWNGVLSDLADPLNEDGRIELSCATVPMGWGSSGTMPRMFWPRPCRSFGPARRSPSAR